jgi:hypothetical protein
MWGDINRKRSNKKWYNAGCLVSEAVREETSISKRREKREREQSRAYTEHTRYKAEDKGAREVLGKRNRFKHRWKPGGITLVWKRGDVRESSEEEKRRIDLAGWLDKGERGVARYVWSMDPTDY